MWHKKALDHGDVQPKYYFYKISIMSKVSRVLNTKSIVLLCLKKCGRLWMLFSLVIHAYCNYYHNNKNYIYAYNNYYYHYKTLRGVCNRLEVRMEMNLIISWRFFLIYDLIFNNAQQAYFFICVLLCSELQIISLSTQNKVLHGNGLISSQYF